MGLFKSPQNIRSHNMPKFQFFYVNRYYKSFKKNKCLYGDIMRCLKNDESPILQGLQVISQKIVRKTAK